MSSSSGRRKQTGSAKKTSQRQQPRPSSQTSQNSQQRATTTAEQARADSRRAQRVIQARRNRRRRQLMILGGGVAIALVAVLALVLINSSGGNSLEAVAAAPPQNPDIIRDGKSMGSPDAPVTVVEYGDFQCPACEFFWQNGKSQLINDYVATGKVRFEFHDYAFLGQESTDAAVAASCADQQGKYWEYHDMLYFNQQGENKGGFKEGRLKDMAKLVGLDMDAFGKCLNDGAVKDAVAASLADGRTLGIGSTPTFVVNGTDRVSGGTWANLQQKIDAALAGQ